MLQLIPDARVRLAAMKQWSPGQPRPVVPSVAVLHCDVCAAHPEVPADLAAAREAAVALGWTIGEADDVGRAPAHCPAHAAP